MSYLVSTYSQKKKKFIFFILITKEFPINTRLTLFNRSITHITHVSMMLKKNNIPEENGSNVGNDQH